MNCAELNRTRAPHSSVGRHAACSAHAASGPPSDEPACGVGAGNARRSRGHVSTWRVRHASASASRAAADALRFAPTRKSASSRRLS